MFGGCLDPARKGVSKNTGLCEMDEVTEQQNLENVCRLCLSSDGPMSSVFEGQDAPVSLAIKIQACVSIQISATDRLSTQICAQCVKNVNQWHTYKETCMHSQTKLQEWLDQRILSTPMVVTIKDEPVDLDFCDDNVEVLSDTTSGVTSVLVNDVVSNDRVEELMDDEIEAIETVKDSGPPPLVTLRDSENEEPPVIVEETNKNTSEVISDQPQKETTEVEKQVCAERIKSEPQEDDDADHALDTDSITGTELRLNLLAKRQDVVMEADSTQKMNSTVGSPKKKIKRGPHTHYRGTRIFKQKCKYCQINLHSKHSYAKHMERFHTSEKPNNSTMPQLQDEVESIEDIEDELVSMENDSSLTQVQQNIIGQLKTFSCYACQQIFHDRRATLSHIRQHIPDLRPYTCIACLTQFPDRSLYKLHCSASFECAMKIALVIPKHGEEKYFTCNMCSRSLPNKKELLNHLTKHSEKQYEKLVSSPMRSPPKLSPMTSIPPSKTSTPTKSSVKSALSTVIDGPYKNGDPLYNHVCDLCGMIYRYKPNMIKHRELCAQLTPEARISYKCVYCNMTFLVYRKFHSHISVDHKKKELICAICNATFTASSEFLVHHAMHRKLKSMNKSDSQEIGMDNGMISPSTLSRSVQDWNSFEAQMNSGKVANLNSQYCCALCNKNFETRAELTEHRNIHLKVKIYSCVICRSMFSSASALEAHMKDHGIEDPNENLNSMSTSTVSDPGVKPNECHICHKVYSNQANMKRHIFNNHKPGQHTKTRVSDIKPVEIQDKRKRMRQCSYCPKSFVFPANLNLHMATAHGPESVGGRKCDLCDKVFPEELSLKIHKTWHTRSKMLGKSQSLDKKPNIIEGQVVRSTKSDRPARAKKSFPNAPPTQSGNTFQCQVCDDKFPDVAELRKHLWDVHCARNKSEKGLSGDELQCELCTNVFPDRDTLKVHMQWHKAHPILSDIPKKKLPCDVCGKLYSSRKTLSRHKRLHKPNTIASIKFQSIAKKPMASQFMCTVCRRVFSSNQSLQRHRMNFHGDSSHRTQQQQLINHNATHKSSLDEPKPKRVKLEENSINQKLYLPVDNNARKKPVTCLLCKTVVPNMSLLYRHKQIVHKLFLDKQSKVNKSYQEVPTSKPHQSVSLNKTVEQVSTSKSKSSSRLGHAKSKIEDVKPMFTSDGRVSCNICYKSFAMVTHLRQHYALKHKNADKYICNTDGCKQSFANAMQLKDHELTHTSMIYCCNLCDRHVFTKAALSEHMRLGHKTSYEVTSTKKFHRETNLQNYVVPGTNMQQCPVCNIKYPNNRSMKVHFFKFHDKSG